MTDLQYVRSAIGDPATGGAYTDEELQEIISRESNLYRAIGMALLGIANSAAKLAVRKTLSSLTKDNTQVSKELREQADYYFRLDTSGSGGTVSLERSDAM